MAGKATGFLVLAGAAALVVAGKKKKRKRAQAKPTPDEGERPRLEWTPPRLEHSEEGGDKLVFDEECQAFADKLNYDKHNAYITGMFHTQVEAGNTNTRQIVLEMLQDQAPNCPWDDPGAYTDLMAAIFDQLLAAVSQYAQNVGVAVS